MQIHECKPATHAHARARAHTHTHARTNNVHAIAHMIINARACTQTSARTHSLTETHATTLPTALRALCIHGERNSLTHRTDIRLAIHSQTHLANGLARALHPRRQELGVEGAVPALWRRRQDRSKPASVFVCVESAVPGVRVCARASKIPFLACVCLESADPRFTGRQRDTDRWIGRIGEGYMRRQLLIPSIMFAGARVKAADSSVCVVVPQRFCQSESTDATCGGCGSSSMKGAR
jgi:hypothetical protein